MGTRCGSGGRLLVPLLLGLLGLLGAACVAPVGRTLRLESEPEGALFDTSWGETGVTPSEIVLPDQTGEIQLRLEGCEDRSVRLELPRERNFQTLARVTFGVLIDPFSAGAAPGVVELGADQDEVLIVLEPVDTMAATGTR